MSQWIRDKLKGQSEVLEATLISPSVIEVQAKVVSGKIQCIPKRSINEDDVRTAVEELNCNYIIHIKKTSVIHGSGLSYCQKHGVGIGSLGCALRAISAADFSLNHDKEADFILRGLNQHTAVRSVERVTNRIYGIDRSRHRSLRVMAINDYDITADSVRNHIANHGRCDLILSSNPYARESSEADFAAKQLNTEILTWAQLLAKLNYARPTR